MRSYHCHRVQKNNKIILRQTRINDGGEESLVIYRQIRQPNKGMYWYDGLCIKQENALGATGYVKVTEERNT